MTRDRQAAAAAERRPEERAIHTMAAIRTTAAIATQSQIRLLLDPLVAGEAVACGVGVGAAWLVGSGVGLAVGLGVTGSVGFSVGVTGTVGLAGLRVGRPLAALAALLGRLEIVLLAALLHPAARVPATAKAAAIRTSRFPVRLCTGQHHQPGTSRAPPAAGDSGLPSTRSTLSARRPRRPA
jgi:hypothetical protein